MKSGIRWIALALTLVVVAGAVSWRRGQQSLAEARAEKDRLVRQAAEPGAGAVRERGLPGDATAVLSSDERLELMRLRRDVTELKVRRRELAGLTAEADALRSKLASLTHRTARQLPPGYVRMADARHRGTATPEAAVETFFWAMANRDPAAFLSVMPVEDLEGLRRKIDSGGADEVFPQKTTVPGFRVADREQLSPDEVRLHLELVPGSTVPMRLRRDPSDGAWRTVDD